MWLGRHAFSTMLLHLAVLGTGSLTGVQTQGMSQERGYLQDSLRVLSLPHGPGSQPQLHRNQTGVLLSTLLQKLRCPERISGSQEFCEKLPGKCPEPKRSKAWVPFRGHCYAFFNSWVESWAQASVDCLRMGASLVSIEDPVENNFIQENIDLFQDTSKSFWIGLHKSYEGEWMWINNDVLDYTNWKPGSQSGDCTEIRTDSGQWSTNSCMRYKSFICKAPKTIVPTEKPPSMIQHVEDAPHGYAGIAVAVVLVIIAVAGLVFFLFRKRISIPVQGESTFDNRLYFNREPSRTITTIDTKCLVANIEQNEQA